MLRTVAPDEVVGPELRAKFDEAARREKAEKKARAKKPPGAKVSPEADEAGGTDSLALPVAAGDASARGAGAQEEEEAVAGVEEEKGSEPAGPRVESIAGEDPAGGNRQAEEPN